MRRDDAQRVMKIIVPLRGIQQRVHALPGEVASLVLVILENQMNVSDVTKLIIDALSEFGEDIRGALVDDGMDRVEPKSIKLKLLQPIQRVMDVKVPYRTTVGTIKIDRRAPRGCVSLRKEAPGVGPQIVAIRAKVVVDNIEEDAQISCMTGFNEPF